MNYTSAMQTKTNESSLPDGWRWVKIGDITEVATGGTPDTNHPEYYGGNIRWLKSGDVKGTYIDEVPNRISQLGLENSNARIHPTGSVMLAMSGQGKTRGTSAILRAPSACSQSVAAILPSEQAIPEIIHYALVNRYDETRRITGDNERTGLNLKIIREIVIPLPPLDEQRRIASRLNEQFAAVESARKAAKEQLRAARQLPSAYLREVFEGEEAKKYPHKQLGELCEIRLGKMLSPVSKTGTRSRPYLRNLNVQWGNFDLSDVAEMDFKENEEEKYALRPGDLMVCEGGEPGRAAVWNGEIDPCYYQKALHRLRPINDSVNATYVMYRLWLGVVQKEYIDSNAHTTIAHLPKIRLEKLSIPVPPIAEQKRMIGLIQEHMTESDQVIAILESQLAEINRLPASLLREGFAGQL
jgi:type I restriction enzyme, S subunit